MNFTTNWKQSHELQVHWWLHQPSHGRGKSK